MKMKLDVASHDEAAALTSGLANPVTKAVVVISGVLSFLDAKQRAKVLAFVAPEATEPAMTVDAPSVRQ